MAYVPVRRRVRTAVSDEWRCLTLSQPWPWAIDVLGKDIENRKLRWSYRGNVILHGGQSDDRERAVAFLNERCGDLYLCKTCFTVMSSEGASLCPRCTSGIKLSVGHGETGPVTQSCWSSAVSKCVGALFATARIVAVVSPNEAPDYPDRDEALRARLRRWHMQDQYGYVLEDYRRLARPVRCRGALGLWRPSLELLEECGLG